MVEEVEPIKQSRSYRGTKSLWSLSLSSQETIETDGSDTLSDIAQQVRPNTVVSMQQTMLALQELNPEAFADGNINRLRSGQVLRVPTLEEIQSIDPRDAVDEVVASESRIR